MSAPSAAPAPSAPPAQLSKTQQLKSGAVDIFKRLVLIPVDKTALTLIPELGHLAPILLTMGALIFGGLTMNPALALLAATSGEAYLIRNLFGLMSSYITIAPYGFKPEKGDTKCESNLHTMTPARFQGLFANGIMDEFPNTPLYFLSFASGYLIQAMLFFKKEMEALGPQYSNRPYIAIVAAALFLALYSIFLLNYSCTGIVTTLLTILLGALVGLILANQNYLLFGKKGVNVMFVAPLERRTGMDFVCVTTNNP